MGTNTTGSLTRSTVDGLYRGITNDFADRVAFVLGNPSGLLVGPISGLAYATRVAGGSIYMNIGNQIWISLGSAEF